MNIIDLTREISNETQVCPCDRTPVIENYATTEEEGVNVKFIKMGTHTATHIDAPYHISKTGKTLDAGSNRLLRSHPLGRTLPVRRQCRDDRMRICGQDTAFGCRNESPVSESDHAG